MRILGIIPARMGSSRFPGKPMAPIHGKPMIGHVYDRVSSSRSLAKTVVATCDQEIFDYISSIGGTAVMTSTSHERASDRCAEALQIVEQNDDVNYDVVVMVQGDEPMTHPQMIDEAINPFIGNQDVQVVNLMAPIESIEEFKDRNCIKVVCDRKGYAIYFSREPIPTRAKSDVHMYKQVCVIPFRRDFLIEYTQMTPTPLEIAESIDMLRILENGMKVLMVPTTRRTFAVDTPDDLQRVTALMGRPGAD